MSETINITTKESRKLKRDSEKLAEVTADRRKLAVLNYRLTKRVADMEKIMENFGIPKKQRKFND